jgi:hypothetical protein
MNNRLPLLSVLLVAAASAVAVAIVAWPGSAAALGRSDISPLAAAGVPSAFVNGLKTNAIAHGATTSDLLAVEPSGQSGYRAALVLAHNAQGDLVSMVTARSFTSFRSPAAYSQGKPIGVFVSAQPDASGETGHVQLMGVAAPNVQHVTLDIADGSSVDPQLVTTGHSGFAFFTYVTDNASTFPTAVHGYNASGTEIITRSLADGTSAPQ